MKHIRNFYIIIAIAVLSIGLADAQAGGGATQHFEKRGLAFDYPFGWTLTDSSAGGLQSLIVASEDQGTQIVVSVDRTLTRSCDFQREIRNITTALVEQVASQVHAASPVQTLSVKTQVGTSDAVGAQLQGVVNSKRVTADVYALRLNQQFVTLIYVRNDGDEQNKSGWEMVRQTMKLDRSVMTYGAEPANGSALTTARQPRSASSSVLNGRALVLPRPSYPPAARSAHVSGTVAVQVVIDETGNVISAHAVFGDSLLQGVSVDAARGAKFSPPKFCGEPLQVTGVITYNFVAQ